MRITNLTKDRIICVIDENSLILDHEGSIDVQVSNVIKFFHIEPSCSCDDNGNSKLLKFLSALDDPFKLRKEFHIHIDCEIVNSQIRNSQQITITANSNYADSETRTYYEYFIVTCDGSMLSPTHLHIAGCDEIKKEFASNNKKLSYWNAIWNVLIEPILLEMIGYFMAYWILRAFLGQYAWLIVFSLIGLNIIIELIIIAFKSKNQRVCTFLHFLEESVIRKVCYKI